MNNILILYYTQGGSTKKMAEVIADGVESSGCDATIRTVPNISENTAKSESNIADSGHQYATKEDLIKCDGLIVGSPSYFGNMASPLKFFLEKHSDVWFKGSLIDKPVGFFTSASGMHAGHESTILSMMIPFIHHGCLIVGVPYSEEALESTRSGGTPYGASMLNTFSQDKSMTKDEISICKTLGKRVADISTNLKTKRT